MRLTIITPNAQFFDSEVSYVNAPGTEGYFGVLENHAPFLSTLKDGVVKATLIDGSEKTFKISGGLADISNNIVKIMAESVE